ncbi:substrate-binding domain-containing protein [Nocardioides conyzicola]|uniref:PBP domain-containing protein n=1 Tax=Nocardioides conyzicola TaxID=1651781 RepID=A0ABP8XM43_9ACTN
MTARLSLHRLLLMALLCCLVTLAMTVRLAGPAQAVSYTSIEGSGSTWSQVILQQWIADVSSSGMQITYNGSGSSQGRKDFANGVTDFGISEIPYQGVDPVSGQADSSSRPYAYLPIVAGGTAFTYHVEVGGKLVKTLRLSGETIAKIFTNKITNWNDAAITADNNGHALPSLPIHPVVRSDGSGTTAQFTRYLATMYPSIWGPFNGGKAVLTSQFPRQGAQVAASGSDQVMNTISSAAGNGTIGYVEYSYPVNAHYPVVKVENKAGYFVEPTQYNVAVALTKAKINQDKSSKDYLTQILDGVYSHPDPRAYPLSSYSYMIIPTGASDQRMTTSKRQTLADFLTYSICAGQSKAGPYGYSPLPLNLVQAGFSQINKLKKADSAVDLTNHDVTKCDNPTFVKGNLQANHLADIAPKPASCDKAGAGPCGTETGTNTPSTEGGKGGGGGGASNTPGGTTPGGTAGGGAGNTPGGVDPVTGLPTDTGGTGTTTGGGDVVANPVELSAQRTGDDKVFSGVAVLELLAIILLPGLYVAIARRRREVSR